MCKLHWRSTFCTGVTLSQSESSNFLTDIISFSAVLIQKINPTFPQGKPDIEEPNISPPEEEEGSGVESLEVTGGFAQFFSQIL